MKPGPIRQRWNQRHPAELGPERQAIELLHRVGQPEEVPPGLLLRARAGLRGKLAKRQRSRWAWLRFPVAVTVVVGAPLALAAMSGIRLPEQFTRAVPEAMKWVESTVRRRPPARAPSASAAPVLPQAEVPPPLDLPTLLPEAPLSEVPPRLPSGEVAPAPAAFQAPPAPRAPAKPPARTPVAQAAEAPVSAPAPEPPAATPVPAEDPSPIAEYIPAPAVPSSAFDYPAPPAPPAPIFPSAPAPAGPAPSPLERESALISRALGALRQERNPRAALGSLDSYRRQFPRGLLSQEADLVRLDALLALGDRGEALVLLDRMSLRDFDGSVRGPELRVLRGEFLVEHGRCEEALPVFERTLREGRKDRLQERALYGRASCRVRSGDFAGGRADLESYLRQYPNGLFAAAARNALGL
ncbi:MAG TPA: tetratricopeptide repeat protein [Myxococcaceae bacterium]|nr:tetratricopeptide repeat protein [Myxococcaceae bacterium]